MKSNWTLLDYQETRDIQYRNRIGILGIMLMIIGIFVIIYKFDFTVYQKQLLLKENDFYVLTVESRRLQEILKSDSIYIENKKYNYRVLDINKDYATFNDAVFQTVSIALYNYETEAAITEVFFLKSKRTLWESLIEFMKGGVE